MDLKRIFPERKPSANSGVIAKLFPLNLIFVPVIGLSLVYPQVAATNPILLGWIDMVLTPTVDALHWIGLGIVNPPMEGPLPSRLYLNETGIAVWGAVIYNAAMFYYMWVKLRPILRLPEIALKRMMEIKQWGKIRAWIAVRCNVYLLLVFFAAYPTACLLNGIYGWVSFHVVGYSAVPLPTLVFVLPGAIAGALWFSPIVYFIYDCISLFKFISKLFRSK